MSPNSTEWRGRRSRMGGSAQDKSVLRCKMMLAVPFAVVAAGFYTGMGPEGLPLPPGWVFVSASVVFSLFLYLQIRLEPLIQQAASRFGRMAESFAGYAWDVIAGGLVGLVVTNLMDIATLPAVLTALSVGGVYAWVLGYWICGEGVGDALGMLFATTGASTPHEPELSRAQALGVQGHTEEAIGEYRRAIEGDPTRLQPYLRVAELHAAQRDYSAGTKTLTEALEKAHVTPEQELLVIRNIVEMWAVTAGEPARAAPFLARLAEEQPDTEAGRWAASALGDIKEQLAEELGLDVDPAG